jgi:hypothetical protein
MAEQAPQQNVTRKDEGVSGKGSARIASPAPLALQWGQTGIGPLPLSTFVPFIDPPSFTCEIKWKGNYVMSRDTYQANY